MNYLYLILVPIVIITVYFVIAVYEIRKTNHNINKPENYIELSPNAEKYRNENGPWVV